MKFNITKRLPSAKVSTKLISDVCKEIARHQLRNGYEFKGIKIDISDGDGEMTISDMSEFPNDKFFNGTKEIKIRHYFHNYTMEKEKNDIIGDVHVRFHRRVLTSEVEIECFGPNAKSMATGLANDIHKIVDQEATMTCIFYPPYTKWAFLISSVAAVSAFLFKNILGENVSFALSSVPYLFFGYLAAGYVLPYSSFDTKRNDEIDSVRKWIVYGSMGAILFGFIGYKLYR